MNGELKRPKIASERRHKKQINEIIYTYIIYNIYTYLYMYYIQYIHIYNICIVYNIYIHQTNHALDHIKG